MYILFTIGIGEYIQKPNSTIRVPNDFTVTNNGIIVNHANPSSLSKATMYLITHPIVYDTISYNSRLIIEKYFTINIQIQKYSKLYQYLYKLYKT